MQAASGSRIVKVSDHQHHRIGSGNAIHFFKDDEWKCSYGTLPTTEVNKDDEIDSDVFIDLEQGECGAKGTPQQEERTGPLGKRPADVRAEQGLRGGSDDLIKPFAVVGVSIFAAIVICFGYYCSMSIYRSLQKIKSTQTRPHQVTVGLPPEAQVQLDFDDPLTA
jgi:hypothetical protein